MPSEPIVLDKYILYKNPKNFSLIEKTVTIATVLKKFLKILHQKIVYSNSILFAINHKYNNMTKKFYYRVLEGDSVFSIANRFNIPVNLLIYQNNLKEEVCLGDLLYLEVENYTLYSVQPLETFESLAKKFNLSKQRLIEKNNNLPYIFYGLKIFV